MAFCNKCGAQMSEEDKVCPSCGAAREEKHSEKKKGGADFSDRAQEAIHQFNNTEDTTTQFDPNDIEANKAMGILSYLSWLVIIPLIAAPKSPFARYHANQGLVLAIFSTVVCVLLGALTWIPVVGVVIGIVLGLAGVLFLVLMVLGIVNAANGKAKELPILGKIRLLQ